MRFALATIFTLAIRALAVPSAPEAPKPSSSPQPNAPQNRDTSCTYSCPRGVIAPASFDLHSSHDFYSGLLCSYTGPRDSGLSCAFSVEDGGLLASQDARCPRAARRACARRRDQQGTYATYLRKMEQRRVERRVMRDQMTTSKVPEMMVKRAQLGKMRATRTKRA